MMKFSLAILATSFIPTISAVGWVCPAGCTAKPGVVFVQSDDDCVCGGGGSYPVPAPAPYPAPAPAPYPAPAPAPAPSKSKYDECRDRGYGHSTCQNYAGRHLKEVDARQLVESNKDCADAEYDMFLVIKGAHFSGLAVPKDADACPNMAFHAEAHTDDPELKKYALQVHNDAIEELNQDNKLHLGTKSLEDIVAAFESAPVSRDGIMYDAISNNCVVMLRNMADPLDIPVDDRMVGFITQNLLNGQTEHIFAMMKKSPTLTSLYDGGKRFLKGINNEELLNKVIKLYV